MEPLDELIAYVRHHYEPLGIVIGGSILRGEGGPNSDYDVFVVHAHPWRLRDQQRFGGVPAELFVNPPAAIRRYFRTEHAAGRPVAAHLLSTGSVLEPERADPIVHALVREARDWLARAPEPIDPVPQRYLAVDLLDDARDVHGLDEAAELLLLGQAVNAIVELAFRERRRFLPRRKDRVRALAELDPTAADFVRRYAAAAPADRLAVVEALAQHVLGVDRFFAWTSPRDPVPDEP